MPEDPMGRYNLSGGFWKSRGSRTTEGAEPSFHMPGNCSSVPGLFRRILWSTHCVQSLISWLCSQTFHMLQVSPQWLSHEVSGHCSSICQSQFLWTIIQRGILTSVTFFRKLSAISSQYFSVLPGTDVVRAHMIRTALYFLWLSVQWSWKEAVCCWLLGVRRLALTVKHLWGMFLWNTLSSAELS